MEPRIFHLYVFKIMSTPDFQHQSNTRTFSPTKVNHTAIATQTDYFPYGNLSQGPPVSRQDALSTTIVDITARELEVLLLICQEYTTAEIAAKLHVGSRTIDGHRERLLLKLHKRNTAGLVAHAVRLGLV